MARGRETNLCSSEYLPYWLCYFGSDTITGDEGHKIIALLFSSVLSSIPGDEEVIHVWPLFSGELRGDGRRLEGGLVMPSWWLWRTENSRESTRDGAGDHVENETLEAVEVEARGKQLPPTHAGFS
jgi:hypothetical protein